MKGHQKAQPFIQNWRWGWKIDSVLLEDVGVHSRAVLQLFFCICVTWIIFGIKKREAILIPDHLFSPPCRLLVLSLPVSLSSFPPVLYYKESLAILSLSAGSLHSSFLFSRAVVGVLFFLSQKSSGTLQFTLLAIKTRVSDCLVGEFSASQAPTLPRLSSSPPVLRSVTWQSSQRRCDI